MYSLTPKRTLTAKGVCAERHVNLRMGGLIEAPLAG